MDFYYTCGQQSAGVYTKYLPNLFREMSMTDSAGELGVIQALIDRFEKQRLPRLLELKKNVDKGEVLSESDIQFLAQVIHDAQQSKQLIDKHPEWHKFCSEVVHLYKEITEQAMNNEK